MKVADFLEHSAAVWPDHCAVTHGERNITFAQLWRAVYGLSEYLRGLPVAPGSRMAVLFENSIEYIICFFAVIKAGFVVVPLDTSANPRTLHSIIDDCGPTVLFCQARYRRHLGVIVGETSPLQHIISDKDYKLDFEGIRKHLLSDIPGDPDNLPDSLVAPEPVEHELSWDDSPHELTAIYYTSGSTGDAKGVMLSHRNLVSNTIGTVEYLRLTSADSIMVILPFYYIYGNSLLLTHVACGGRVVIDNRFLYPEVVLDTMEAESVTGFSGVPSNFIILLGKSTFTNRKLESLRYFTQAGGAMAPDVTRQLMKAFGHKEIWIMYGQTEASPRASYLPPEMLEKKLGSIGIAVPGVTLTVVDDEGREVPRGETGQIGVTGPNVMLGYWNQPEETKLVVRNGMLLTGDLARQDEDGYFYVVGRKKEIIKTGGNRVSSKEVEECLLKNDKILEVAVFGVPDDLLGEAIKAVVVLKSGARADKKEIQAHCKRYLAPHKAPKYVLFMEELPKYQSGKVNKPLLASQSV